MDWHFGAFPNPWNATRYETTSRQYFRVGFRIKPNNEGTTFSQSRRTQVPGRAEKHSRECGLVRLLFPEVNMKDFLPFHGVDFIAVKN